MIMMVSHGRPKSRRLCIFLLQSLAIICRDGIQYACRAGSYGRQCRAGISKSCCTCGKHIREDTCAWSDLKLEGIFVGPHPYNHSHALP